MGQKAKRAKNGDCGEAPLATESHTCTETAHASPVPQHSTLGMLERIGLLISSIPVFQGRLEEDIETWMVCDEKDWGFQMLNNDEIMTSVQEESDLVYDETDD
ncbi:hypothetical protein TNCV_4828321 [Trichonephila clavipes]|uniref:Uncharacterized protein n=1 Tax=Trichonephila clavipes TaxID=2585209 RepID=A0A8X6VJ19_TRICX|nr:hypothetical protein TNCV_4828321 [Trichonephila clavipes]